MPAADERRASVKIQLDKLTELLKMVCGLKKRGRPRLSDDDLLRKDFEWAREQLVELRSINGETARLAWVREQRPEEWRPPLGRYVRRGFDGVRLADAIQEAGLATLDQYAAELLRLERHPAHQNSTILQKVQRKKTAKDS